MGGEKNVSDGRECYQRKEIRQLSPDKSGGILAWVEAEELFCNTGGILKKGNFLFRGAPVNPI